MKVLVPLLILLAGCASSWAAAERPPVRATASDIAAGPNRFEGRAVRVRARVAQVVNPHVFTLADDAGARGDEVLVLVEEPAPEVREEMEVMVTGIVRPFVYDVLRLEYEWLSGFATRLTNAENRPAIIATSVRGDDGADLAARVPPPPLALDESRLGERVTLAAVIVERIIDGHTVAVRGASGAEVIVRLDSRRPAPRTGDVLDVSGVVRKAGAPGLYVDATSAEPETVP